MDNFVFVKAGTVTVNCTKLTAEEIKSAVDFAEWFFTTITNLDTAKVLKIRDVTYSLLSGEVKVTTYNNTSWRCKICTSNQLVLSLQDCKAQLIGKYALSARHLRWS